MKNEKGFIGVMVAVMLAMGFVWLLFLTQMALSEQNVSGIVYNTQNSKALTGNTSFCVRAGVDTYVSQQNQSCYCLPPHSPYIPVVNKAAADKSIKVVVTTRKYFRAFVAPWTCVSNVTVTETK